MNTPAEREVRSQCRICTAVCGTRVVLRGDEIVSVKGDPDHPLSRGYTCVKGRAMVEFHTRSDRLDVPVLRGEDVDWPTILDAAAAELRAVIDRHGPEAVGYYSGMGEAHDRAGAWAKRRFFDALGSQQRYTAATVDCAPGWRAAELVTGYIRDLVPEWEPERSPKTVIFIGANPVVSHGVTNIAFPAPALRLRNFVKRGGDLWVIDPRRTETAALATHHLAAVPGSDALIMAWLVRELLRDGADEVELRDHADPPDVEALRHALAPFTRTVVAERAGVGPEVLDELVVSVRASGTVACLGGTGVGFGPHALVTEWLIWVLHIITGSVDRPDGMRIFNSALSPKHHRASWTPAPPEGRRQPGPASRPELSGWFDELPVAALPDEIAAGHLRALFVIGANPLTAFPDAGQTADALRQLDLLAVFDVKHHPITALATHAFPITDMFERPDIDGRESNMFAPALVPPRALRRPEWWVLAQLARRLGLDILDGDDPDTCDPEDIARRASGASPDQLRALKAAGPHGIDMERPIGWVRERALPGGRWRIAPSQLVARLPDLIEPPVSRGAFQLVSRRLLSHLNSVTYDAREPQENGAVVMHPDDAQRIGAADGALVEVRTGVGAVSGRLLCDPRMRVGTVFLPHGDTRHNVNRLIDRRTTVDVLTGQPVLSSFNVDVVLQDA